MSEHTKIQWCDHTFNPWIGCAKVSPGCAHCYAEVSTPSRAFGVKWGKGEPRRRTSALSWKQPLRWNRQLICDECAKPFKQLAGRQKLCEPVVGSRCINGGEHGCGGHYRRPRVFCASLADWLDDEVPIEWLADLLKLIHDTPNLDWLLLTKRPGNFVLRLARVLDLVGKQEGFPKEGRPSAFGDWLVRWLHEDRTKGITPEPPANVWVGTTVEDQQRAEERIPELLRIPARVRFLSVEPLLGAVDLSLIRVQDSTVTIAEPIHWVIVGGESGPQARPCNVEWIRSVVRQCQAAGVPCFVKQLGAKICATEVELNEWPDYIRWVGCSGFGVAEGLKHNKGGDPAEWPEDLRVREFPQLGVRA